MTPKNTHRAPLELLMVATLSIACEQAQPPEGTGEREHRHAHDHHGHAFTDKASVEEMAKHFGSPERDTIQRPDKVLEYLGDLKGRTVMDIGAGTGYFSVRLAHQGAHVLAADISDEFQQFLGKRIKEDGLTNIELRKIPYDDPMLADAEADLVFVANTYHHIEGRTAYFTKVRKGLKPTGALVVVDYFQAELPKAIAAPPVQIRVSVDEVVFELRAAGFTDFDVEVNVLPYQYIIKAQ